MPYGSQYFLHGFGVFLGVIAGVVVTLIVQWYTRLKQEAQVVENFKFELKLNIKKIDVFLGYLTNYRNKANSDSLDLFFRYFDLSRTIWLTTNYVFRSGLLYRCLEHLDIEKLQETMWGFSRGSENHINDQLTWNKLHFNKRKTNQDIDFWEKEFKRYRQSLQNIAKKVKPPQHRWPFKRS